MSSFNTALSALKANATALDVVGNNLANLNSTGFKASTVAFSDLASQAMSGSSGADGAGVTAPSAVRQFVQGGVQLTSGSFDAAIQGEGFFVVQDSQGRQFYTRAGNFRMDASGNLVTQSGESVLGWVNSSGTLSASGAVEKISLPTGAIGQPVAATQFSLSANLDANATVGEANATFSSPVQVVDSLGNKHTLTATFTKTDANKWHYEVTIPAVDVGSDETEPTQVAEGDLTFDENGKLTAPAADDDPISVEITGLADGAADMTLNWVLFGADQQPLLSQFANPSAVSAIDQNGRTAASLVKVAINDGGRIVGLYSDGSEKVVAQIALAYFRNPDTLHSAGNNNLVAGGESSAPTLGVPDTGGRGSIVGGALESSTTDIAREFTNLIMFQRGYQANSRVITTMNELSQDTLNLVR